MTNWQPIETAPKDGTRIDLWAKSWIAMDDQFTYDRFTSCYWYQPSMGSNSKPCWSGLARDWHATHWMPIPNGPKEE